MRLSKLTFVFAALFVVASGLTVIQLHQPQGSVEGVTIQNYAAVPANPYNQAAQQIDQKQIELQNREQALNQSTTRQNRVLIFLFILTGALFVLTGLNFYLDIRRSHAQLAR